MNVGENIINGRNCSFPILVVSIGILVGLFAVLAIQIGISPKIIFLIFVGLAILLTVLKRLEYGLVLLIIWQFVHGYILGLQEKLFSLLIVALGIGLIIFLTYQCLFFRQAISDKFTIIIKEKNISFWMFALFVWVFLLPITEV